MQPANSLLLFCQKYGLQAYIMSALLWSCIWNWYIQSLIIALCAVLVLPVRHRNRIGYSTSIFRNHNLESFHISAWLPIFLLYIMLAHQAALKIQGWTSVEVINNNRRACWLNESNISEMSKCVLFFCMLLIWLLCQIDTCKSLNHLSWQFY